MYSRNGFGSIPDDLRNQDREATRRRLESAPSSEVIKWAIESLRDYNSKLESLEKETKRLTKESSIASVELKRLKSLAPASSSGRVTYLRDMHRNLVSASSGIGSTLKSCRQAIKEAVTNYQLIRQTLNSPLADHKKKIEVQERLSRSIQNLDNKFAKCSQEVASQKKVGDQLSQAVTKLLDQFKGKLPNYEQERITQEDKVAKLALDYKKFKSPQLIAKNMSSGKLLGDARSETEGKILGYSVGSIAAVFIGIYLGTLLCGHPREE